MTATISKEMFDEIKDFIQKEDKEIQEINMLLITRAISEYGDSTKGFKALVNYPEYKDLQLRRQALNNMLVDLRKKYDIDPFDVLL